MYHLLHAGMAREPPLPLRHGSWPLQRHTSILHITNVSFASASVCPSSVIALKCVSHTLASCVTGEVVLWFGTWNCMPPPSHLPLFSFHHLGSPLKWHCISTVVGQRPCHCCVCHFLRFVVVNAFSLHLNFSLFVSVCLSGTPLSFLCPRICCLCPSASICHFRYFFPPLDPPREGTRYGHLLPPSSLIEHCDAEPVQPQQQQQQQQQQALPRRHSSRALLSLPEAEGQWSLGVKFIWNEERFWGWVTLCNSFSFSFFKGHHQGFVLCYMTNLSLINMSFRYVWQHFWHSDCRK